MSEQPPGGSLSQASSRLSDGSALGIAFPKPVLALWPSQRLWEPIKQAPELAADVST